MSSGALDVFISYSHRDEALRAELEAHLAPLRREGTIRTWNDRKISAGSDWAGEIDRNLESADLILLLISPQFLASDYCFSQEMERALTRHGTGEARVIPVIVRPTDWQSARFARLQALPQDGKAITTWSDRDLAFLDVVRGIRDAIVDLRRRQEKAKEHAPKSSLPKGPSASPMTSAVPEEVLLANGFDPAESAGLFVGVRQFDDEEIVEVPFAVDDAVDLAHLFAMELALVRPERVILSLSGEPQKPESQQRLAALLEARAERTPAVKSTALRLLARQRKASGPKGLFVASFATHGFSDGGSDILMASDSLCGFMKSTGVELNEVFSEVSRAGTPRRLVLIDACRERFKKGQRGTGSAPLSASFAEAITRAQGLVVLSGTVYGGYAYDDRDRRNGVFTASVLDGLRGAAPFDSQGFVTVQGLADYVNDRVLAWVRENRQEDVALSQGISRRIDGAVAGMPLVVDGGRLQAVAEYRQRREAALMQLRSNLHGPLTGAIYDEMQSFLSEDLPSGARLELLGEIEALDCSERMRRNLAFYWANISIYTPAVMPSAIAESQRRGLIAMPPAESVTTPELSATPASSPTLPVGTDMPLSPPIQAPTVETLATALTPSAPTSTTWVDPVLGIRFAYVEPGTFWMGSPKAESGRLKNERQHRVTLSHGFWVGTMPITQEQFARFIETTGYQTEAEREGFSKVWNGYWWANKDVNWRMSGGRSHPVVHVSWNDVKAFCKWLNEQIGGLVRLPSEAEWEYAARAGSPTATYSGDLKINMAGRAPELDEIAWYKGNSGERSRPVGEKRANAWGLFDMLGNVNEWVEDASEAGATDTYRDDIVDPVSTRGSARGIRGGSWFDSARCCRAAYRDWNDARDRGEVIGFRLVRIDYGA